MRTLNLLLAVAFGLSLTSCSFLLRREAAGQKKVYKKMMQQQQAYQQSQECQNCEGPGGN